MAHLEQRQGTGMKKVAILGSTGSIGRQAVEVVQRLDDIVVTGLAARSNGELMAEQARLLGVKKAALSDEAAALRFADLFAEHGVELLAGSEGVIGLATGEKPDIVLNSIVGSAGLEPTLAVLEQGVTLALANKESLVAGGSLVTSTAERTGARIIPVDSEHSAIFQCLLGEDPARIRRLILTASGGPFRDMALVDMERVTVRQALAHPTWNMGPKVTIDSATLMNKGLEVLEAQHLFGVGTDRIDVLVHPQSIVHSMVEMADGSVLAHLGVPDMRIPIQYSLTWPDRKASPARSLSLGEVGSLVFEDVDTERFPALGIAYEAAARGGTCPAAMNAANEEAVAAFLDERLRFIDIATVVARVVEGHEALPGASVDEIREAEGQARLCASREISAMEKKN
jgi:1-deoxy-D-xylulose-5-phosphate reductoisomerase